MNRTQKILFSDTLVRAQKVVNELATNLTKEVTLVRDLRGRIRVVLPTKPENAEALNVLQSALSQQLGVYGFGSGRSVLFANEIQDFEVLNSERRELPSSDDLKVYLLDRQIIGQDWMRDTMIRTTTNPRITFYGVKGGVGRSTALVNWAWYLAEQGKKVLVFDLDLESPGVSSSLLPKSHLPDYGIVDWFVEDGVGQAQIIESELVALSPLSNGLTGEISVVPAYGKSTQEYLPKLARCYSDFSNNESLSWAERLQKMVICIEEKIKPDVVIFDSRAGLHDIAAVLVTRMDADTFLFALDTPQTWAGYSLLFQHWNSHPNVKNFRNRLQIIASMVPETDRDRYIKSFKESSWELFRENIYDYTLPQELDNFSFDLDDESAPHWPIPIYWHRALQEFNPGKGGIDAKTASEALGTFFKQADCLLETSGKNE